MTRTPKLHLRRALCGLLLATWLPAPAAQATGRDGADALDFFLGHWEVDMLDADDRIIGKARTHAYRILDGQAIQDDWRSLDREGNVIFHGTSIRTWSEAAGKWVIHWVMAATPGHTYIEAVWNDGELHGNGRGFDQRGQFEERFRYHDITDSSYSFLLERTYDGGKTWSFMNRTKARKVEAPSASAN